MKCDDKIKNVNIINNEFNSILKLDINNNKGKVFSRFYSQSKIENKKYNNFGKSMKNFTLSNNINSLKSPIQNTNIDIIPIKRSISHLKTEKLNDEQLECVRDINSNTISEPSELNNSEIEKNGNYDKIEKIQNNTISNSFSNLVRLNLKQCRICLEKEIDRLDGEVISPCLCEGTMKYVHQSCIKKWIITKINDIEISKNNSCEVCKKEFKIKYNYEYVFSKEKTISNIKKLFCVILGLISIITVIYLLTYLFIVNLAGAGQEIRNYLTKIYVILSSIISFLIISYKLVKYKNSFYKKYLIDWNVVNYDKNIIKIKTSILSKNTSKFSLNYSS